MLLISVHIFIMPILLLVLDLFFFLQFLTVEAYITDWTPYSILT